MSARGFNIEEYLIAVGFGLVPGITRFTLLGNNPDVDQASVPEHIWHPGGLYPWPAAAVSLEVVSSSIEDAAGGTGASSVAWGLLNGSHVSSTVSTALNGTTPVALSGTWLRVNSGVTNGKGSGAAVSRAFNAGDITLRVAGGGTVLAVIPAGKGILRQTIFTVPAGFTAQIISNYIGFNRGTGGGTTRYLTASTYTQTSLGLARLPIDLSCNGEPYRHDGIPGIVLPEKTDFALEILSVSSDNSDVTAASLGVLKQNQMP